nr:hypothetical protein DA06_21070 [Georgenia sp. SUBG003]
MVPSALVLAGPLESNGWPARLLVFALAAAIVLGWLRRPAAEPRRTSPAEAGCWILLLGVVVSFGAAQLRLLSGVEFAGAVRVALVMIPLTIVALGVASLGDSGKADMLLTFILVGAAFSSVIAMAQFVVPFDLAELLRPPGFVAREVGGMGDRGGFLRVKGTSTHPIEFGVLSGAMVPVALHFARFAATTLLRHLALLATGFLAMGLLLSVTRSAVLTLTVAMVVYAMCLSVRERLNLLVVALGALVLVRATLPGLLGTITGFFLGAAEDDSVTARLDDYPVVDKFFAESPWIGRGLGTFLPEEYVLLDNQYLMSLVEGGIVLLGATIAFFVLALASARGRRHARHVSRRRLAGAGGPRGDHVHRGLRDAVRPLQLRPGHGGAVPPRRDRGDAVAPRPAERPGHPRPGPAVPQRPQRASPRGEGRQPVTIAHVGPEARDRPAGGLGRDGPVARARRTLARARRTGNSRSSDLGSGATDR